MKKMFAVGLIIVLLTCSSGCGERFTPDVDVTSSWVSDKISSPIRLDVESTISAVSELEDTEEYTEVSEEQSKGEENSSTSNDKESKVPLPEGINIGDTGTYSLTDENGLDIEVDCLFSKVISGGIDDTYISDLVNDYNLITPPEENMELDENSTYVTIAMEFKIFSGREKEGVFPSYYQVPYPEDISLHSTMGDIKYEMGIYDRDFEHHFYGETIKGWVIFKLNEDVDLYSCYVTLSNGNDSLDYKIKRY